ncbi:MAG: ras-domain-containing protein [Terrestrivirus sp.]|uniref:Ras-domain-containing protein n=1 Tax=Terrestrivirus sp. TaxID=2487775 RepID=A0A3G4ZQG3_9VIRU|nr:MAG: ras-domain-containing protein [Terrestrivirus sp.]
MSIQWDCMLKAVLVGEYGVGKTHFLMRYIDDYFGPEPIFGTSGACMDFRTKTISYLNKSVRLQIWDVYNSHGCFNHGFGRMQRYYRNTDIIVLMFSLNDEKTFNAVESINDDIEKNKDVLNKCHRKILVGTKLDLVNENSCIDKIKIYTFCEKYNYRYVETSAKSDIGIKLIFDQTVNNVLTDKIFSESKLQK